MNNYIYKLGSVVVDLFVYVPPIVCEGSVLVCFGMHFYMSFLVLQSS